MANIDKLLILYVFAYYFNSYGILIVLVILIITFNKYILNNQFNN